MSPQRIQLSRRKGWRKPPGAIVVARPSRWGNPWRVTDLGPQPRGGDGAPRYRVQHVITGEGMGTWNVLENARQTAASQYRTDLYAGRLAFTVEDVERELAGHNLACWCPLYVEPNPRRNRSWLHFECHADVLLEIAAAAHYLKAAAK